MKPIKYSLKGGLTDEQMEDIHKGVLRVLEKVGIEVNHKRTLRCLSEKKGVIIN